MNTWILVSTLFLIVLTAGFVSSTNPNQSLVEELFTNPGYSRKPNFEEIESIETISTTEFADFDRNGLLLADMFQTQDTGVLTDTRECVIQQNRAKEKELESNFVQRTNNYRKTNPESCSSFGSLYKT
jgi:hypothetical protein